MRDAGHTHPLLREDAQPSRGSLHRETLRLTPSVLAEMAGCTPEFLSAIARMESSQYKNKEKK